MCSFSTVSGINDTFYVKFEHNLHKQMFGSKNLLTNVSMSKHSNECPGCNGIHVCLCVVYL